MNIEQLKQNIKEYMQVKNVTFLRKSYLYEIATQYNYEIEDLQQIFSDYYDYDITSFYEVIDNVKYQRYILGNLNHNEIATITQLTYCDCCNVFTSSPVTTENGKTFCSINCANRYGYYYCSKCNKLEKIVYSCNDIQLCKNCIEQYGAEYNVYKCNRCNNYRVKERLYTINNKCYCNDCVDNMRAINGYHGTTRQWKLFKKNRENNNSFGYENELEIKNGNTPKNYIVFGIKEILKENNLENFFIYENDGSLSYGFEAITNPFTLAWLYDNENKLQKVYDFLLANNCTAEKCNTTGLHIHFNREQLTKQHSLAKIAFLINNLQYDFCKLANRKLNNLGYTCFDRDYNNDNEIKLSDYKRVYNTNSIVKDNHGCVVNTQHSNTIEIRLFKGTLDLKRIIANVELVNNLIYFVENKTDKQIENATFKDIVTIKKTRYLKSLYFATFGIKERAKKEVV